MIAPPIGVRVYLACGYTDMRKGARGLTMLVQQVLAKNPFDEGTVYAFRGRRGNLLKLIWHDGIGLCMLSKKLERGQFIWPMASTGSVIMLSAGQLSTLLEGCEWRAMARNLRPELAG
jgi:transposase